MATEADYYLKIDGIDGESQDKEFPKWIQITSFSWGGTNSGDVSSGASGKGKVKFHDVSITAPMNAASPSLAQYMANGKPIASAELAVRVAGDPPQVIKRIKLAGVFVSKFVNSGDGSRPVDTFTLNYAKINFDYGAQDEKGKVSALDKKMGFDLGSVKQS